MKQRRPRSTDWRPGRATGWTETVFQAQCLGRRQRPGGISQRAVSAYGHTNSGKITVEHQSVDLLRPAGAARCRAGVQPDRPRRPRGQRVEAGPAPFLGSLYEMGAQGVAFEVPQHHTEMIVLLNREGLESTLPDMSAGVVMLLIPANMSRQQPVNPPAQVPIALGPKHQMEMIGHQAVSQDSHGVPERCLGDHVEKRLKVPFLVENLSAGIAPVQYVIAVPSNRGSGCPRHGKGPRQEAVAPTASYFTQTTWRTTSVPFGSPFGSPGTRTFVDLFLIRSSHAVWPDRIEAL